MNDYVEKLNYNCVDTSFIVLSDQKFISQNWKPYQSL